MFNRVLKAQSDHRSRHEGKNLKMILVNICLSLFYISTQTNTNRPDTEKESSLTCLCFSPVTHYSMWLLVSWAHCSSTVKSSLADSDHLHDWLKKLTLLVPEVSPSEPPQVPHSTHNLPPAPLKLLTEH